MAVPSSSQPFAAPVVVSLCHLPKMGGMGLAASCPQCPGMTYRLRFHTGASYLSCACHSINSVCALVSSPVSLICFMFLSPLPQTNQTLTLAFEVSCWAGQGPLALIRAGGQAERLHKPLFSHLS